MLNLCGSLLIAFSLYYNFNLASALMEFFWILISLLGIRQRLRRQECRKPKAILILHQAAGLAHRRTRRALNGWAR